MVDEYPMGTILQLSNSYALRLIDEGVVERYTGPYYSPLKRKHKLKTQLFKPK